jgi:RNA polymerase sigma factor (sigma-70 family)
MHRPPRLLLADTPIELLVPAAQEGCGRAWEELVNRLSRLVAGIARSHRLSDADAADAAQATWARLVAGLSRLKEPRALVVWVTTIARRECLRIKRLRRDVPCADMPELADEYDLDAELLSAERTTHVRAALSRLDERDQALLNLLSSDSPPSYDEIAVALDMPRGSIGPTRARALRRLQRELEAQGNFS